METTGGTSTGFTVGTFALNGGGADIVGGGGAMMGAGVETTGLLCGRAGGRTVGKVFAEVSLREDAAGEIGKHGMSREVVLYRG